MNLPITNKNFSRIHLNPAPNTVPRVSKTNNHLQSMDRRVASNRHSRLLATNKVTSHLVSNTLALPNKARSRDFNSQRNHTGTPMANQWVAHNCLPT